MEQTANATSVGEDATTPSDDALLDEDVEDEVAEAFDEDKTELKSEEVATESDEVIMKNTIGFNVEESEDDEEDEDDEEREDSDDEEEEKAEKAEESKEGEVTEDAALLQDDEESEEVTEDDEEGE